MTKDKQSLILGWPEWRRSNEESNSGLHPLNRKLGHPDLSYAIKYEGDGHCITFASTGAGKGVGVIIPNLLHFTGSVITIDPKGENFAVTTRYRQRTLGQKVFLLDPFNAVKAEVLLQHDLTRAALNPLDLYRVSGAGLEDAAQMIAQLMVPPQTDKGQAFWDNNARALIAGLVAHELTRSEVEKRPSSFGRVVDNIFPSDGSGIQKHLADLLDEQEPIPFVVRTVGGWVHNDAPNTRDGILATAYSHLSNLISGGVLGSLTQSPIDLEAVVAGGDYTIYIVIPPNKLESHANLLRVWVGVLLNAIMERDKHVGRTLFLLDECANLGDLPGLRKAVTLLRGYGVQMWLIYQDLAQLTQNFPFDHNTIINNCAVIQAFGLSRLSAAAPLASIVGTFTGDELMQLDRTQQMLSFSPGRVRTAKLFKYYKDEAFARPGPRRWDQNPMRPPEPSVSRPWRDRIP